MTRCFRLLPVLSAFLYLALAPSALLADPFSDLIGRWRWIRSTDGLTGEVETPESTGEERILVLRPTGQYVVLRNGTPWYDGPWAIQPAPENCGASGIEMSGFLWCGGVTGNGSFLSLDGSLVLDGPLEEYEWFGPVPAVERSWTTLKDSFDP